MFFHPVSLPGFELQQDLLTASDAGKNIKTARNFSRAIVSMSHANSAFDTICRSKSLYSNVCLLHHVVAQNNSNELPLAAHCRQKPLS